MKLSKRYVFRYYKRHPMKRSFFQDNLFLKITTHSTLQVIHIQSFIFYFSGDCSSPIKRSFFWTTFSIEKLKMNSYNFTRLSYYKPKNTPNTNGNMSINCHFYRIF